MPTDAFSKWRSEVFRSGALSPLELGMNPEQVVALFGPPDDQSAAKKNGQPVIMKYADLEFHFDHKTGHRLYLVFSDDEHGTVKLCIPAPHLPTVSKV